MRRSDARREIADAEDLRSSAPEVWLWVSDRVIARSVGIGRTAIAEYVRRAAVTGITLPIPEELDDTAQRPD
jgi:hypothetical protein